MDFFPPSCVLVHLPWKMSLLHSSGHDLYKSLLACVLDKEVREKHNSVRTVELCIISDIINFKQRVN